MIINVDNKQMESMVLLNEEQIKMRVKSLADKINVDYTENDTLVILIVLHGAILFAADLIRYLNCPTIIETIRLSSYSGLNSTGVVNMYSNIPDSVRDKSVLIIEDIIDSGKSLSFLLPHIKNAGAKNVKIATLLDKPEAHVVDIRPDYVGFSIGKNFVIGYGLDLDGKFRNLPYIAELVEKV